MEGEMWEISPSAQMAENYMPNPSDFDGGGLKKSKFSLWCPLGLFKPSSGRPWDQSTPAGSNPSKAICVGGVAQLKKPKNHQVPQNGLFSAWKPPDPPLRWFVHEGCSKHQIDPPAPSTQVILRGLQRRFYPKRPRQPQTMRNRGQEVRHAITAPFWAFETLGFGVSLARTSCTSIRGFVCCLPHLWGSYVRCLQP